MVTHTVWNKKILFNRYSILKNINHERNRKSEYVVCPQFSCTYYALQRLIKTWKLMYKHKSFFPYVWFKYNTCTLYSRNIFVQILAPREWLNVERCIFLESFHNWFFVYYHLFVFKLIFLRTLIIILMSEDRIREVDVRIRYPYDIYFLLEWKTWYLRTRLYNWIFGC